MNVLFPKYRFQKFTNTIFLIKIAFVIIFLLNTNYFAQPKVPQINQYANDFSNTISAHQLSQINIELEKFDKATSNQIILLIIPTLNGYPLEMYANEVAMKNKIGTKEHNNGVLFLIAKNDKKMRIEVGYGLEGAIPDALASSIIRNEVAPYFKQNDYYSGVIAGLSAIIAASKGEYTNNRKRKKDDEFSFPWGFLIFIIIFLVFGRNRGGLGALLLLNALGGSGRSSSGFGGGGFSGGGFSGGGGSFGGGGASGGW